MAIENLSSDAIENYILLYCTQDGKYLEILQNLGIDRTYFFCNISKEWFDLLQEMKHLNLTISRETFWEFIKTKERKYLTYEVLSKVLEYDYLLFEFIDLCKDLKQYKLRRDLYQGLQGIISNYDNLNLQEIYHKLNASLQVLSIDGIKPLSEIKIRRPMTYNTGYEGFEEKLSINQGDLIILAGRPSTGKSALALSLAMKMEEHSPTFFSIEMSDHAIMGRIFAMIERKPIKSITNCPLYYERTIQKNIIFDFTPRISTADIFLKFSEAYHKFNSRLIFIDYLQLATTKISRGVYYSKNDYIGKVSADIKAIAKYFNVPIIACAQLNRKAEGRKVSLGDIRDSGEIEQNADTIIAIEQDGEVNILKQRNGEIGKVNNLHFRKEYCLWE